jgi:hypothetical protein
MNYISWKDKINKHTFFKNRDSINLITIFFKNFATKYSFIKIEDNVLTDAFNNIINYQKILIAFDVEFQQSSDLVYIREFGAVVFIKDDNENWFYIGNILLNFRHLSYYDINLLSCKYIQSTYATVSYETKIKMKEIDNFFNVDTILDPLYLDINMNTFIRVSKQIDTNYLINKYLTKNKKKDMIMYKIDELYELYKLSKTDNAIYIKKELDYLKRILKDVTFQIYGKDLKGVYLKNFKKQWSLYLSDKLVKQRTLNKNGEHMFLTQFIELINKTYFVVKGKMDIYALRNTSKLIFNKRSFHIEFPSYYDIEIFNALSKKLYGNARLETTYDGVINTTVYKKHADKLFNEIFRELNKDIGAHNPMVDSLYTIIVALVMNMGLDNYFLNNGIAYGGNYEGNYEGNYKYKYNKYKSKYLFHII